MRMLGAREAPSAQPLGWDSDSFEGTLASGVCRPAGQKISRKPLNQMIFFGSIAIFLPYLGCTPSRTDPPRATRRALCVDSPAHPLAGSRWRTVVRNLLGASTGSGGCAYAVRGRQTRGTPRPRSLGFGRATTTTRCMPSGSRPNDRVTKLESAPRSHTPDSFNDQGSSSLKSRRRSAALSCVHTRIHRASWSSSAYR